ncbi:MAG: hypothetical protein MAG453_00769 [Calditrichaeota bacterium]|nr:hypothetical protein [Calditrichota bacterium]
MRTITAVILPAILLLAGCMSLPRENLEIIRYTLRPDSLGAPADTTLGRALAISPFEAGSNQRSDRIVYLSGDHEMDTYYYHRWIATPTELLTDALTDELMAANLFEHGVYRQAMGVAPSHELHGRVVRLLADNRRGEEAAVLEIVLFVFEIQAPTFEKQQALRRTYRYVIPRDDRRVEGFVTAANEAVSRWLADVRADLRELLARPAESPTAGDADGGD